MKKQEITIRSEGDRDRVIQFLQTATIQPPLKVTMQTARAQRSIKQNSTWHGWFGIIAAETGHTMEEVKRHLTNEFTPLIENPFKPGEFIHKTTSELTTEEGAEFMQSIYQWACEFQIYLPHPDDQGR